jgi:hypothetical protein
MTRNTQGTAEGLLRLLAAPENEREGDFWAWQCVETLIDEGKVNDAWAIILRAIQLAPADRDLRLVGAGVLESLLYSHGTEVIETVAKEAERDPRVLTALRAAYLPDAEEVVQRRLTSLTS